MKIVHFAPFGPNACGMYEAARDMVVADHKAGHEVQFVDVGATSEDTSKQDEPKVGVVDMRGDIQITTATPNVALDADILVFHTGVPDKWVVKTQAPIIFILHGRPAACFATEHKSDNYVSFSLAPILAGWPRVKKLVTFWRSHVNFWSPVVPEKKLHLIDCPPIDKVRFGPEGKGYDFEGKIGKFDVVVADTWRSDSNVYELLNGALMAAEWLEGIKFHLFCIPNPPKNCWELLFEAFRKRDAMGVIWDRKTNMEEVYRAADLVLSPQRIATRSVIEPLACGTPVIANTGCDVAPYKADMSNPFDLASAIELVYKTPIKDVDKVVADSNACLDQDIYSKQINSLYREIV